MGVLRKNQSGGGYPPLLAQLPGAPAELYFRGELKKDLFERCLAVVGSRHMSDYGKRVTERLVFEIAARGITIVSGFMYGVDVTAHRTALAAGGRTIAVVAFGLKRSPLAYLSCLYQQIVSTGGLILSEYGGHEAPKKFMFPRRNRIIAGLCEAVLVIEAGSSSGSLITAGYAKQYGRKVMAVPGSIESRNSEGTLELIKEGATMARCTADVLSCFGISRELPAADSQDSLVRIIFEEPATFEELAQKSKMDASLLGKKLSVLSLCGQIREESGRFYVNNG